LRYSLSCPRPDLHVLRKSKQLFSIHYEVLPVNRGQLVAGPRVVHSYGVEVAHLNADVAAHAARVVDEELVDDLASLALTLRVLRVVLHRHGHALHGAGPLASVAARAERFIRFEVPQQDGEGPVPLRHLAVLGGVLDRHRLAEHGAHRGAKGLQYTNHETLLAARPGPTRSSRGGCLVAM